MDDSPHSEREVMSPKHLCPTVQLKWLPSSPPRVLRIYSGEDFIQMYSIYTMRNTIYSGEDSRYGISITGLSRT